MSQPTVLIILDGWGIAPVSEGNAISNAHLTVMPNLWNTYPHAQLQAAGAGVGLPDSEDGNSETGHINIGAGRIVDQDVSRINKSIEDGSFFKSDVFNGAFHYAKLHKSNVHIVGILSDASVHGCKEHLCALLDMAMKQDVECVYLHLFSDGRDALPRSAIHIFSQLEERCLKIKKAKIATVMGRYYGMDRDRRWERTQKAYIALTDKAHFQEKTATEAISHAYARGETDEFIEPTIITDETGKPLPRIKDNNAVIFFNFRIDRPRQLTRAFVLSDFETHRFPATFDPYTEKYTHKNITNLDERSKPFQRKVILKNLFFATMTQYEPNTPCVVAFPPYKLSGGLAEILSNNHIRQLHAAESEKERFVTYYFNGLHESAYMDEDRLIIPSLSVATYDLAPEMAAIPLTDQVIDRLKLGLYGFIVINFANPDMVGHTGSVQAAIKACKIVDACVGRIVDEVLANNGTCFITADHGNVEEMLTADNQIETEHSKNPVPFICCNKQLNNNPVQLPKGVLGDIAPTILYSMRLSPSPEMTGKNLLDHIM